MDFKQNLPQACQERRLPSWVAPVLERAAKMKSDKSRRRKAYRLIHRKLFEAGIGLKHTAFPTYVYPEELKALIRVLFPRGICDYPDPNHSKVVHITIEDLFLMENKTT
ncbi:hypothetical protein NDU88_012594 [Pleurodeles waltl]|uniref:Uncharacterized protein n=1 Tax=Pleurodeles waltl TaxID=8319 RepID=A0AAV7R388_PLEWA|nr:hypothetical protein NDU88_012594 [Pleurodeles waltl]